MINGRGRYKMQKLLLSELRVIQRMETKKIDEEITQRDLSLALVDEENLRALGYRLKPEGILRLAKDYQVNPELTPLYKRVMEYEPEITASPMYPDFPKQVLEMSEQEFRAHQLIHYMTTYGLESLLGISVDKGWLPNAEVKIERKDDEQIARLKVVDYLDRIEVYKLAIKSLFEKKERLNEKELTIARTIVCRLTHEGLELDEIPFKENINAIFVSEILNNNTEGREDALAQLEKVMKHPGDIIDFVEHLIVENNYKHLTTATKRAFVKMIESYPLEAIEENLASNRWSQSFLGKGGKKRSRNRNIAVIDYLSYSKFSKNTGAMDLVKKLKSGKLISWNQKLEKAYKENKLHEVLELLRQRPGIYFRNINRLMKQGVDSMIVSEDMRQLGAQLKTQSIVSALNNFSAEKLEEAEISANEVDRIFFDALLANISDKEIEELRGKKVFIDENDVLFDRSRIEITDKFADGGYITNGLALKLPESAKFLRFFTYWNDDRRVDIDLHCSMNDGVNNVHVGWNGSFRTDVAVHSGDITHSDAAEYIDFDLEKARELGFKSAQFNINSYTGIPFKNIETVFTGVMLVGKMREDVKLYDAKNVEFRHDLNNGSMSVDYGILDLESNVIYIVGKTSDFHNDMNIVSLPEYKLTLMTYLQMLLSTQGAKIVEDRDEADVVLGLAKSEDERHISLLDVNYFM